MAIRQLIKAGASIGGIHTVTVRPAEEILLEVGAGRGDQNEQGGNHIGPDCGAHYSGSLQHLRRSPSLGQPLGRLPMASRQPWNAAGPMAGYPSMSLGRRFTKCSLLGHQGCPPGIDRDPNDAVGSRFSLSRM